MSKLKTKSGFQKLVEYLFPDKKKRSGKLYFKREGNKILLDRHPIPKTPATERQMQMHNRFREATRYAKMKMDDPDMKELYETGITDKKTSAYSVALTDALTPPKVHDVKMNEYRGSIGDRICIKATDDFRVVRVSMAIVDRHGNHLECGDAVRSQTKPQWWYYITKTTTRGVSGASIIATAFDLAENEATLKKVISNT